MSGTSMATPLIGSRAAALLVGLLGIAARQVRQAILQGARRKLDYHGADLLTLWRSEER
jgi:hypothetical protein